MQDSEQGVVILYRREWNLSTVCNYPPELLFTQAVAVAVNTHTRTIDFSTRLENWRSKALAKNERRCRSVPAESAWREVGVKSVSPAIIHGDSLDALEL